MAKKTKKTVGDYASLGGKARKEALSPEERSDIARRAVQARWAKSNTSKFNDSSHLPAKIPQKGQIPNTSDGQMELSVYKEREREGIEMGVLSDGTPFLTGRALAILCGINPGRMSEMNTAWNSDSNAMANGVKKILAMQGIVLDKPYKIEIKRRRTTAYAYSDVVCLAVLEYWALDAPKPTDTARKNYRLLAGKALEEFIYTQVGYDPTHSVPNEWKQFHDRVSLAYHAVPVGYFSIFKEMADMVVTLGQAGLHIDNSFVPDISVGQLWSKYWAGNELSEKHGERTNYLHNYPPYFPQAESNPQPAWCYPDSALGDFRRWMREVYIGQGRLKKYLTDKVREKQLPASFAQIAIEAYEPKALSE
jgi:hypothetical protein